MSAFSAKEIKDLKKIEVTFVDGAPTNMFEEMRKAFEKANAKTNGKENVN